MHVLPHPPASWSYCGRRARLRGDPPRPPPPEAPFFPPAHPRRLRPPAPVGAWGKKRNARKGEDGRGRAALPRPGKERGVCGGSPRENSAGFQPRRRLKVGGWSRGGVFAPFPAETSPNSGCFEAPTCGSRGGFYFQARTMLPRTKFVGGGRGERSPPRPGSPANDRGDGLCPSPPAPPSPGGSLQAASVTSPALTGLRLETAEKGIFSLAARLILEFLLPQPLASKRRPARTSAPRQRGEQPPGLSPLSREGGCVEKKR